MCHIGMPRGHASEICVYVHTSSPTWTVVMCHRSEPAQNISKTNTTVVVLARQPRRGSGFLSPKNCKHFRLMPALRHREGRARQTLTAAEKGSRTGGACAAVCSATAASACDQLSLHRSMGVGTLRAQPGAPSKQRQKLCCDNWTQAARRNPAGRRSALLTMAERRKHAAYAGLAACF